MDKVELRVTPKQYGTLRRSLSFVAKAPEVDEVLAESAFLLLEVLADQQEQLAAEEEESVEAAKLKAIKAVGQRALKSGKRPLRGPSKSGFGSEWYRSRSGRSD